MFKLIILTRQIKILRLLVWFCALQFLFQGNFCHAQDSLDVRLEKELRQINLKGMLVSGGWSLAQAGWSAFALMQQNDLKTQSFHQMNLGWSAVNLVIFSFGTRQSLSKSNYPVNLADACRNNRKNAKIFKINAFLDVLYVATGTGMVLFANTQNSEVNNRLKGFGSSVILQGTYLLAFDGLMFFKLKNRNKLYGQ